MKLRVVFSFLFLSIQLFVYGQTTGFVNENKVYKQGILTVECYNTKKEQSIPIITLGTDEKLILSFDDLRKNNQDYSYTIEHCTSDWQSSRLSPIDYLESFNSDRIVDYRLSFNTIQKYTHYELTLPNYQIKPKIAGNYILKVYEDGNLQKPVISQRFYITNNQVNVGIEVVPSTQVSNRTKNQKINFNIFHPFPISNPYNDVRAIVMQNFDSNTAKLNNKPSFIRNGTLVYADLTTNDFPGGNEFRKFDTRSLRFKGENVQEIIRKDLNSVILYQDQASADAKFANKFDENGNFFIRGQDNRDGRTEADYVDINFSLKVPENLINDPIYVVGRFNNYTFSEQNKLTYSPAKNAFYGKIPLKQGLYDYKYYSVNSTGAINSTSIEGSFFETENSYQVFVYFKRPGSRWEELVGFSNINTNRRQ